MGKIAFLFSGQGAQTVGMGRKVAESLPAARRLYDRARPKCWATIWPSSASKDRPRNWTRRSTASRRCYVTSLAALEMLREQSPDVVLSCEAAAGLSLGEYTAMVFAGVMEFEDGLMTVQKARRGDAGSG